MGALIPPRNKNRHTMSMPDGAPQPPFSSIRKLPRMDLPMCVVALWFALLAGLLEGLVKWGLPVLGLAGSTRFCIGDLKVLWAPVAVDLALFVTLAIGMVVLSRLLPRWPWLLIATGGFATLLFYGLLAVTGLLRERGSMILALGLGVVVSRWMREAPVQRLGFLRRTLVPLAAVTLVLTLGPWPAVWLQERIALARAPEPPAGAPNVLLIVMDTVRADRLGAYGYARPTTPFLDELARQGVLFERAVANSSWSLPSHVTLMTGRLPGEHGGATIGHSFDGRFPTLARVLASRGYATGAFVANAGYASCARGLGDGFQRYEDSFAPASQIMDRVYAAKLNKYLFSRVGRFDPPREWNSARTLSHTLLEWVDARGHRPFFAFLNLMETHYPYAPPEEFAARFADGVEPVRLEQWSPMRNGDHPIDPVLLKRASDLYDASLASLDDQLRELFTELDRRGLNDNLLVIITSDHGESFGEHGLLEHQIALYADQIHVPLILRMPGKIPASARVAVPVGLHQVAVTIAKFTATPGHPFPGIPLDDFWRSAAPAHHGVISEVAGGAWPGVPKFWPIYKGTIQSYVTEQWHLLLTEDSGVELFDWKADPREEHNLALDPGHTEVVAALRQRLQSAIKQP